MVEHASLRIGDEVASGLRRTGLPEWNRFAAVNDEFVPLHMDDEAGRAAGYPGAIAMGRLQWSWAHRLLREWLPGGRILTVELAFRRPVTKDVASQVRARVTGLRTVAGERLVDVDLWVEDELGAVLAPGTATVVVGQR